MSANTQINAIFATNPPDVLIYLSFPNQDMSTYYNGLVLESMAHDHMTQTLHSDNEDLTWTNSGRAIKWYTTLNNSAIIKLD